MIPFFLYYFSYPALCFGIFHFCILRPSKFNSGNPPFALGSGLWNAHLHTKDDTFKPVNIDILFLHKIFLLFITYFVPNMGLIPWTIKSVTIKGIILSHCLHSYPLQTQISKFWKKKVVGDFIILHMCTKNHNRMMYGSWDMKQERPNFWSFWPFFEKMKKTAGDTISLHIS